SRKQEEESPHTNKTQKADLRLSSLWQVVTIVLSIPARLFLPSSVFRSSSSFSVRLTIGAFALYLSDFRLISVRHIGLIEERVTLFVFFNVEFK
ncbi:hypothetical protein EUTSA_v10009640mg, partial [Eutrema salsugineum]